jgi:hypothetical protein
MRGDLRLDSRARHPAVEATLHPSMSTAVQASSAERRTSGRPRPPSPRCQHPYVAGSPSRFRDLHVIEPERTPDGTKSAYLWIPVVLRSLRHRQEPTLAVAPGSALRHSGACRPQRASWSSCGRATSRSGRETGPAGHRARRSKRARGHIVRWSRNSRYAAACILIVALGGKEDPQLPKRET